jgi:hypothetical protein
MKVKISTYRVNIDTSKFANKQVHEVESRDIRRIPIECSYKFLTYTCSPVIDTLLETQSPLQTR